MAPCDAATTQWVLILLNANRHKPGNDDRGDSPGVPPGQPAPESAPASAERGRSCVIIADHEQGPRLAARFAFEQAGFVVRVVSTAAALRELLSSATDVSVVLIDLGLPGLHLQELERSLERMSPRPRVTYLARGAPAIVDEIKSQAAVIYKPFSPSALLAHILRATEPPPADATSADRES
jgi:DNA-binding NtrC family response regulator